MHHHSQLNSLLPLGFAMSSQEWQSPFSDTLLRNPSAESATASLPTSAFLPQNTRAQRQPSLHVCCFTWILSVVQELHFCRTAPELPFHPCFKQTENMSTLHPVTGSTTPSTAYVLLTPSPRHGSVQVLWCGL